MRVGRLVAGNEIAGASGQSKGLPISAGVAIFLREASIARRTGDRTAATVEERIFASGHRACHVLLIAIASAGINTAARGIAAQIAFGSIQPTRL